MTKKEMYMEIRNAVADNADMVAFIDHEVELLDRKANAVRKPTQTQVDNEKYKDKIVDYLTEVDTMKTISELQAGIPEIAGLKNQRISHLLKALRKEKKVKTVLKVHKASKVHKAKKDKTEQFLSMT